MITIHHVCEYLKEIAPLQLAEEWDNVGLLLGDESVTINKALTCLTLTPEVADEAVATGAGLVVTHHPILFKPIKKITSGNAEGRLLLELVRHGVAVYSPHTAWDNSPTGINQQLAELFGLQDIGPLRLRQTPDRVAIITFVPEKNLVPVRQAAWNAGAGCIGNYHSCSFSHSGTGTFYGMETTNPAVGQAGRLEQVDEIRLEVVCPADRLESVLRAIRAAHPYEEPAIDVFTLRPIRDDVGAGRCGNLPQPVGLGQLCQMISERLGQSGLQFTGSSSQLIQRVGIACGAAGEYLRDAHRAGCDLFITGEARFHSCLEAIELGIAMILPGHYATERFAMEVLANRLKERFTGLLVTASSSERNPLQSI